MADTATKQRGITGLEGEIVYAGDPDYDRRRAVWNAMHDRRPALIARCFTPDDVAAAVAYGRREGMPIAVRGGGHSMPGHSTCDDGIVIDLREINDVQIDPDSRRAKAGVGRSWASSIVPPRGTAWWSPPAWSPRPGSAG